MSIQQLVMHNWARCSRTLGQVAREYLRREAPIDEDEIAGIVGPGNAGPGAAAEEQDQFLVGPQT